MKRRNTALKNAVLTLLQDTNTALSHENIQVALEQKADRTTIYRILNRFCDDGITHRIVGDDGKQYFAICDNCSDGEHQHDHFHFRCLVCSTVECLEEEISLQLPAGYQVSNFNGVISGRCPNCR